MKMENTTMMPMVCAKEFWETPRMMQKEPPKEKQIHSHQRRPRMPKCLAAKSEMKPPAGKRSTCRFKVCSHKAPNTAACNKQALVCGAGTPRQAFGQASL